jgi:hypothetical protein
MPPQAGVRVEPVVRQQPVAVGGDQLDRRGDVAGRGLRDEVVEVDPGPAGFDPVAAVADLLAQGVRADRADGQQPVPVRPGAGASAAGLDAEQVVEQRDDEVVVQVLGAVADAERDDSLRQPRSCRSAAGVAYRSSWRPRSASRAVAPRADLEGVTLGWNVAGIAVLAGLVLNAAAGWCQADPASLLSRRAGARWAGRAHARPAAPGPQPSSWRIADRRTRGTLRRPEHRRRWPGRRSSGR